MSNLENTKGDTTPNFIKSSNLKSREELSGCLKVYWLTNQVEGFIALA